MSFVYTPSHHAYRSNDYVPFAPCARLHVLRLRVVPRVPVERLRTHRTLASQGERNISFSWSNTIFTLLGSEFELVPQSGIPPLNEITPRLKQTIRLLFSFRTVSWGPLNSKIRPQTSQLTNPSGGAAQQRILVPPPCPPPPATFPASIAAETI